MRSLPRCRPCIAPASPTSRPLLCCIVCADVHVHVLADAIEIAIVLDKTDRLILEALQKDATASVAELAAQVHLSPTPCWRRLQRLEKEGYIVGRVALLDAAKLNVGVTVFVEIKTSEHTSAWVSQFQAAIRDIPEIVEVHRMSGHIDYLLKVVVPNITAYDKVYKQLIASVALFDVSSGFSMERLKSTTQLPLDYAD